MDDERRVREFDRAMTRRVVELRKSGERPDRTRDLPSIGPILPHRVPLAPLSAHGDRNGSHAAARRSMRRPAA
jgi:hypothetical protein